MRRHAAQQARVTRGRTETKDHCKWGVSMNSAVPVVCFGDINRMTTQVWHASRRALVSLRTVQARRRLHLRREQGHLVCFAWLCPVPVIDAQATILRRCRGLQFLLTIGQSSTPMDLLSFCFLHELHEATCYCACFSNTCTEPSRMPTYACCAIPTKRPVSIRPVMSFIVCAR